jgi:hypothetical protein
LRTFSLNFVPAGRALPVPWSTGPEWIDRKNLPWVRQSHLLPIGNKGFYFDEELMNWIK